MVGRSIESLLADPDDLVLEAVDVLIATGYRAAHRGMHALSTDWVKAEDLAGELLGLLQAASPVRPMSPTT